MLYDFPGNKLLLCNSVIDGNLRDYIQECSYTTNLSSSPFHLPFVEYLLSTTMRDLARWTVVHVKSLSRKLNGVYV